MRKSIRKQILEQLQYQTKLLETIVETASLGGAREGMQDSDFDKALDMVMKIPIFAKLSIDREKIGAMIKPGGD